MRSENLTDKTAERCQLVQVKQAKAQLNAALEILAHL